MNGWHGLQQELDAWTTAGRRVDLWWRDDDAVEASAALDRLLDLASTQAIPLAIAVIPARMGPGLGRRLAAAADLASALQHGFAHDNHAPAGEKKAELGDHRHRTQVLEELARGHALMAGTFGVQALPVLVPPWNRIAAGLVAELPALGLTGLSTYGPRRAKDPASGLRQTNTHVDIMRWGKARGFLGESEALGLLCAHLQARRLAGTEICEADPAEPTGLLTHHLAHDEAAWDFLERLLPVIVRHAACRFVAAAEAFGRASPDNAGGGP